jgi:hypothetical protein
VGSSPSGVGATNVKDYSTLATPTLGGVLLEVVTTIRAAVLIQFEVM